MNEFKVGDEAWCTYSYCENPHIEYQSTSIWMDRCTIEKCELTEELIVVHDESIVDLDKYDVYATKNEAIDAMIERLNSMREHE